MEIERLKEKYGMLSYNKLLEKSEKLSIEGYFCGYADCGDFPVVVAIKPHTQKRLRTRFEYNDIRTLLTWFVSNVDNGTDLQKAICLVPDKYEKMGLYSDKLSDDSDIFMYVWFTDPDVVEITTVVDSATGGRYYYCDTDACPVWLKKDGRAVVGFERIPILRPSKNTKFGRHRA